MATPAATARRRSQSGRQRPITSATATTANGHDTHETQLRWAESGRCSAWGRMPRLTRPTASSTPERPVRAPRRRCQMAKPSSTNVPSTITLNQRKRVCEAERWGSRHHGGISSATACSPPSSRSHDGGRGSSRPARRWNTGSTNMPSKALTGPAITRCTHIGISPTARPISRGRRLARPSPQHPSEDEAHGQDEVGPERQRQPAEDAGDDPGPHGERAPASPSMATPRIANTADHSVSASPPFHAIAVSATGVSTKNTDSPGHRRRRQPAPRSGQREQPEDDPEVLEQPERPLGRERVAEHLVPAQEGVQRAGAVEVEEVDVGDLAVAEQLGEVEHEALFHRPAGEAVEAAAGGWPRARRRGRGRATSRAHHGHGGAGRPSRRARRRSRHRRRRGRAPGRQRSTEVRPRGATSYRCLTAAGLARRRPVRCGARDGSDPARADGGARPSPGPRDPPRHGRRRAAAARGRRRPADVDLAPGARPGDDGAAGARRRHVAHPVDRAARAHRHLPGPGQPSRPAELLPAGADVSPARIVVVGAGGGDGRHPPRGHRRRPVDRPPPPRLAGRRRRRAGAGARRAGLRPAPADPAVEPVPAAGGVARRAAGGVVGGRRRPLDARPARRRRVVLRPDPRALPPPRGGDGRARPRRRRRPLVVLQRIWCHERG